MDLLVEDVVIEDGAWLTARVIVNKGVRVRRSALVLPGSVITKGIPAGKVFGGAPAAFVKDRWEEEVMRLLLFGLNYAPEPTSTGKYTGEMGSWLASRGHSVDAIVAPPYYPQWEVSEGYSNRGFTMEKRCGVGVPSTSVRP